MKHVLVVFFVGAILASCGVSQSDAVAYNDSLINEQTKVINSIDALLGTFSSYDGEQMDKQYAQTVSEVKAAQDVANGIKEFDGSTAFRDSFVSLLGVLESGLKSEYPLLITNLKIPNDEYTEEDEAEYNKIATASDNKFEAAQNDFLSAQRTFADKYGFVLIE